MDTESKILGNPTICDIKSTETKDNNLILQGNNSYYTLPYYTKKFFDNSSFNKFVKSVEKIVRKSDEYSAYLGYLRNNLDLSRCAYLGNIDTDLVSMEFHHYPFTLYDVICMIVEKMLDEGTNISTFTVADICINHHFQNIIGLIPVTETVHELIHSGEIFVNLNYVFGYFDQFIQIYEKYLYPELVNNYNKLVELSSKNFTYSDKDILKYNG